MISAGPAAVLLVASVGLTWFLCLRPMVRGRCATVSRPAAAAPAGREAEIARRRAEIRTLRRQAVPQGASVPAEQAAVPGRPHVYYGT